jgi:hypothetical protein
VYADDLLKHPNEHLEKFFLFTTDYKTRHKKVFSFDSIDDTESQEPTLKPFVQENCPFTCKSKLLFSDICVNDAIKCNGVSECDDEIDEKNCIVKPGISDYLSLEIKNHKVEENSIYFNYILKIKDNKRAKIDKFYVKLMEVSQKGFITELKPILDRNNDIKINNLLYDSKYDGIFYVNVTDLDTNSVELIEFKEHLKFEVKSKQTKAEKTIDDLDAQKMVKSMENRNLFKKTFLIIAIILLLAFCVFLCVKINSFLSLNLIGFFKIRKVAEKAVVYKNKAESNIKNSILNMKHSNIGPRYDLSPFTTDDKDLLIEASHN